MIKQGVILQTATPCGQVPKKPKKNKGIRRITKTVPTKPKPQVEKQIVEETVLEAVEENVFFEEEIEDPKFDSLFGASIFILQESPGQWMNSSDILKELKGRNLFVEGFVFSKRASASISSLLSREAMKPGSGVLKKKIDGRLLYFWED